MSQGYFLAAYLYMTIVFVLPLAAGVLALALDLPVSIDEAYGGLILPASAYVIMGKSGGCPGQRMHAVLHMKALSSAAWQGRAGDVGL